jgi:hypothetical protein
MVRKDQLHRFNKILPKGGLHAGVRTRLPVPAMRRLDAV